MPNPTDTPPNEPAADEVNAVTISPRRRRSHPESIAARLLRATRAIDPPRPAPM